MTASSPPRHSHGALPRHGRGVSLVEALVAMLLFAVGFLAIAGLQLRGITNTRNSYQRTVATLLATEMADKILANRQSLNNNPAVYTSTQADILSSITPLNCHNSGVNCNTDQVARNDLYRWYEQVSTALPGVQSQICYDDNVNDITAYRYADCDPNHAMLVIKIQWTELAEGQDVNNAGQTQNLFLPIISS